MGATNGDVVRVHYRGTLEDGSEFDSSAGRDPLEFVLGEGSVIPGFEAAVTGLEPGDTVVVTIVPEEAYGPRYEEAVQSVGVDAFAEPPNVGEQVGVMSGDGQQLVATITAIDGENVTLDFNHPLAGETLVFEIELVEIAAS